MLFPLMKKIQTTASLSDSELDVQACCNLNSMLLILGHFRAACCWTKDQATCSSLWFEFTQLSMLDLNSMLLSFELFLAACCWSAVSWRWKDSITDLIELIALARWEHSIYRINFRITHTRLTTSKSNCSTKFNQSKHKAKARIQLPYSRFDKRVFQFILISCQIFKLSELWEIVSSYYKRNWVFTILLVERIIV